MPYLHFKKSRIYYELHGKGPALLYIHEWNTTSELFRRVNLQFFKKDFRVLLLDLPGYGKSEMIEDLSFDVFEELITALLDKLKIKKASMMGFCMGGNLVLDYAVRKKNRVNRLIVIDVMIEFPNILKLYFLPVIGKGILNASAGTKTVIRIFTGIMFNRGNIYLSLFRQIAKTSHGSASYIYMKMFYDYSKHNHIARLKELKAPVLSMHGDRSPGIVKRSVRQICKNVRTAVCTEMNNSRHFVMLEHPRIVYEQVKAFLEMKL
jgi:3-oxoadipate enol-lactonase